MSNRLRRRQRQTEAEELNDMPALAIALAWAAAFGQCQRNPAEVNRLASELIELSTRYHFALWLPQGVIYRGWARAAPPGTPRKAFRGSNRE
jgi:hypothetical protein